MEVENNALANVPRKRSQEYELDLIFAEEFCV
ncbi:hypothetical protein PB2503_06117 [Parvularcula bermudensis HTCC2503]|uniref:Uncharacterized protein n=1 Tax=Parvularcula bermudensis (strain ATCC BAA-594 / HTCC2503 / KCTC 12087) TaxID=314260 RepID=E0THJ5_PARBH|nr:hypothetical protein PB2503_06117 [Parvularcula bermudensis HTCC2503]